jgi:release factor glutamine methyltransferase
MHLPPTPYSKLAQHLSVQASRQQVMGILTAAGNDCAGQEATFLLQEVTHQSPTEFFCNLQRTLTASETMQLEEYLARRLRHEPLQYILRSAYFYGREFHVDSRVLIPRPETELLVETVLEALPCLPRREGGLWLADIGTGSACIAVTLACELPAVRVLAVDRSRAALQVARANIAKYAVGDRVHPVQTDLAAATAPSFGAIVANLPYIRTGEIAALSPEIARFEPREALDGGEDGLGPIRRLCAQARHALLTGGRLVLEVGDDQAEQLTHELTRDGTWDSVVTARDLRGASRVVTARRADCNPLAGDPAL